jgi:AraC-like DNA-binding protein
MDHGLIKASQRLSELELKVSIDGWSVEVYWFRAMIKERDWFIRRHMHGTFEFHFAAKGDCVLELDAGTYPVPEGCFYVTAPEVYHTQRRGASGEFVEYSLNCDLKPLVPEAASLVDGISRLRSTFLLAPCVPRPDENGAIPLFEAALIEADARKPGYEIELRSLILRILVACARAIGPGEEARGEEEDGEGLEGRMARITSFIEDNIHLRLSPADIAAHMNLGEKQVGRIVARHKGYSTQKFITRTKLKRAKQLLTSTDMTIKEIAEELGFSNEYYFNSVFRLHEGYPPGVFRESMQGGKSLPGESLR